MTLNSSSDSLVIDRVPLEFVDDKITLKRLEDYLLGLVSELENELSTLPEISGDFGLSSSSSSHSSPSSPSPIPTAFEQSNEDSIDCSSSSLTKYTRPESPVSFITTTNYSPSFYEQNDEIDYNLLTASQIQRIIDFYKPILRTQSSIRKDNFNGINPSSQLFGLNVDCIEKQTGGLSLPPFIEDALIYLIRNGLNSVGIFRKSGVKSRIMALRKKLESMSSLKKTSSSNSSLLSSSLSSSSLVSNFSSSSAFRIPGEDFCAYDVADMVKMWLREMKPRPLVTKEIVKAHKEVLSNTISTVEFCLRIATVLTDSQRAILEIFIHFLSKFAANSESNQMTSQNLAICFTPSLCECDSLTSSVLNGKVGKKSNSANALNDMSIDGSSSSSTSSSSSSASSNCDTDTKTIFDAQKCLQFLIDNYSVISMFSVSSLPSPLSSCNGNLYDSCSATNTNTTVNSNGQDDRSSSKDRINGCLSSESLSPATSFLTTGSLMPPAYETSVIVNASPRDILKRILYQRSLFDPTIVEWRIIEERPQEDMDIFEFKVQTSKFLPIKTFTIERRWTFVDDAPIIENQSRSSCFSLKKCKTKSFTGIILQETGYLYESRWKIGSHGKGRCQVEISIAIDLRGHSLQWYTYTFPAIIDWQLHKIKHSFLVDFIEAKRYKSSQV